MKYTPYIIIVGLLVWVYLLSNKPEPEPVEILNEIQVGQDSVIYWKSSYEEAVKKGDRDSVRWHKFLNLQLRQTEYFKREMNKRRDIPVPEADSLTELMLKNISVGGGR